MRAKGDVVAAKPGRLGLRERLRIARRVALIAAALAPGAPTQWLLLRVWPSAARRLPTLFHRYVCAVIGVRRDVRGVSRGAVLLVANHMSWLDIVVLSACRPTCFVGKSEIADWPLFGALARLQDTLFVDRARRIGAERDARDIARRLACGQSVTLFAEGTSSDGCGVLPFRSALFGVAREASVALQPVALAYLARNGERLDAQGRRDVAWWGDKALAPHLIEILALKSLDVRVEFGEPERPSPQENRKALARRFEQDVRRRVEAALA